MVVTVQPARDERVEEVHLVLKPRRGVKWSEETVDNEGLGRKSSKRCCIFHKRRKFDESESESGSEAGSGSEGEGGGGEGGRGRAIPEDCRASSGIARLQRDIIASRRRGRGG